MVASSSPNPADGLKPITLVIDDDDMVRSFICGALQLEGFDVREAKTGREAIGHIKKLPRLALIVTDIFMPDSDGIDVLAAVRKERFATAARPKVLVVSGGGVHFGFDADEFLAEAKLLGADASLTKPFNRAQLHAVLVRLGLVSPLSVLQENSTPDYPHQ